MIFLFWDRSEKVKITGLPVYLVFFFEKLLKFNQEIFNEDLHFAIEQLANLITSHPFFLMLNVANCLHYQTIGN